MAVSPTPANPQLKIEVARGPSAGLQFALLGPISHDTSPGLLQELLHLHRSSGQGNLTLNLRRVDFVDSQGIGVICNLHQELEKQGFRLRITGAGDSVRRVLTIMRLDTLFEVA